MKKWQQMDLFNREEQHLLSFKDLLCGEEILSLGVVWIGCYTKSVLDQMGPLRRWEGILVMVNKKHALG